MDVLKDEITIEQFGDVFAVVQRRVSRSGNRLFGQTICLGTFRSAADAACVIPV